jgi:hypothetical protein
MSAAKMTTLTFVEFLEANARASTCMFKCSPADQQGAPPLHSAPHLHVTSFRMILRPVDRKPGCAQQRVKRSPPLVVEAAVVVFERVTTTHNSPFPSIAKAPTL